MKKLLLLVMSLALLAGCSTASSNTDTTDTSRNTVKDDYKAIMDQLTTLDYYETIYTVYSGDESGEKTNISYSKHYTDKSATISYNFAISNGVVTEGGFTTTVDNEEKVYYTYGPEDISYISSLTITSSDIATPFDVDAYKYYEEKSSYNNQAYDLCFVNEAYGVYIEFVTTLDSKGLVKEVKTYTYETEDYTNPHSCSIMEYIYTNEGDYSSDLADTKALEGQSLESLKAYLPK